MYHYISLLKNKCIEYKNQIIFSLIIIALGMILSFIHVSKNIENYKIVFIKSNMMLYYFRFIVLFFFVYLLIFISIINKFFNILTIFAGILLGYFFGKFLVLTFVFNLENCIFSIIFFFNFIFFLSYIFYFLIICLLRNEYFNCGINSCIISKYLCKILALYSIFCINIFVVFIVFSNFTNAVIII